MAIYRPIHVSFWSDSFVLGLTPEEKYFFLYLMTNPKTQQSGIYELPKSLMQFETGYNSDTINKLLKKFVDYGKIKFDETTNEVMIINWLKYNYSNSPKVLKCIQKEILNIKSKLLKKEFDKVCIGYKYSISTSSQEEEKEEETKNKNKYDEFVFLTESEYQTLTNNYGNESTLKMIAKLNNYKGASGKTYKSDYRAILSWVVESVIETKENKIMELNS